MPVFYKATIKAKEEQLDMFYQQIKEILKGSDVASDLTRYIVSRPEDASTIVSINMDKLLDAIGHFKVSVESLKRLNTRALKPSKEPLYYPDGGEPF